jgi:hypothetical protein
MRPKSIIYFERVFLGTLALGVLQSFLAWKDLMRISTPANAIFIQVFTFAILTTLTLFVSRRRSKIAMWISIAMFVLGLPLFFIIVAKGLLMGSGFVSAVQAVGQLAAYALLFTPSARAWMNREPTAAQVLENFD